MFLAAKKTNLSKPTRSSLQGTKQKRLLSKVVVCCRLLSDIFLNINNVAKTI